MVDLLTFLREKKKNHSKNDDIMICVKIADDSPAVLPALEVFLHERNKPLDEGSFEIKDNETLHDVVEKNLSKQIDFLQKSYFDKMDKELKF